MDEQRIHWALQLIDEWVATLPEERLLDACANAGNDFFVDHETQPGAPRQAVQDSIRSTWQQIFDR